jgi:hypothetical protein
MRSLSKHEAALIGMLPGDPATTLGHLTVRHQADCTRGDVCAPNSNAHPRKAKRRHKRRTPNPAAQTGSCYGARNESECSEGAGKIQYPHRGAGSRVVVACQCSANQTGRGYARGGRFSIHQGPWPSIARRVRVGLVSLVRGRHGTRRGSSLPIGTLHEKRLTLWLLRTRKTRGLRWDSVARCGGTGAATGSL